MVSYLPGLHCIEFCIDGVSQHCVELGDAIVVHEHDAVKVHRDDVVSLDVLQLTRVAALFIVLIFNNELDNQSNKYNKCIKSQVACGLKQYHNLGLNS